MVRRWAAWVTAAIALLVLSWLGLWLWFPSGRWWMEILNRSVLWLMMPLVLLGIVALVKRWWLVAALAGLPLAILVSLYWPYWWPRQAQPADGPLLRVMTYNVLYSNTNVADIAGQILRFQPDVVLLQEVKPEQWEALRKRLADYPYGQRGVWGGFDHPYGTAAVLSRYPLDEVEVVNLREDRPAVIVRLAFNGQLLTLAAVHLAPYGLENVAWRQWPATLQQRVEAQERQVEIVQAVLSGVVGPVVIGCDCNALETTGSYRLLATTFTDAGRTAGWRLGPSLDGARLDLRWEKLDYVWYRGPLVPQAVYVANEAGGSDHYPVVADFVMARP